MGRLPGSAAIVMLGRACGRLGACRGGVLVGPAAVWAVLAVILAVFSSLAVGLAVNAVPKSWGWARNWWLLIGIRSGLLVAAGLVAAVQARSSPGGEDEARPGTRVGKPRWSPVAGSNVGTMISAKKILIGVGAAGPGTSSPTAIVPRPGAGDGERAGDNLSSRNPVFTGRDDILERSDAGWMAGRWRSSPCAGWGAWASRK